MIKELFFFFFFALAFLSDIIILSFSVLPVLWVEMCKFCLIVKTPEMNVSSFVVLMIQSGPWYVTFYLLPFYEHKCTEERSSSCNLQFSASAGWYYFLIVLINSFRLWSCTAEQEIAIGQRFHQLYVFKTFPFTFFRVCSSRYWR